MTAESRAADATPQDERHVQPPMHLQWNPDHESGNVHIDSQHRALVSAVNALIDASKSGPPDAAIARLDELISLTLRHFSDEEEVLHRNGYQKLAEHAKSHARLIEEVLGFRERMQADPGVTPELVRFLVDVVVERHMAEVDKQFFGALSR